MTAFTIDYNEATDFGGVTDGTYEVIVNWTREDVSKNGAEYINVDLIIRNDMNQNFKNAHIFYHIWRNKTTKKYHRGMIQGLAKAFSLPNGKQYQTFDDFLDDFTHRVGKVTVANEKSTGNDGKEYENLEVKKLEPTTFTQSQHQFKEVAQQASNPLGGQEVNIPDEDLPF